jgi:putative salt-induced outer membrane protein YdiY
MQFFLMFFLLLLPMQAQAIINAEGLGIPVDKEGLNGKAGLSVNGSSGNTDKINGEGSGRLAWKHGEHTEILAVSYAYGKSRGQRDTNKSFVHLRHRYALDNTWDVEAFGQAQQNEFARLKLRTLFGGGMRWSQQDDEWRIHLGLGSFYESETLRSDAANTAPPRTRLWRGNVYGNLYYALNDRVGFQNTLYFQPAWKDMPDYRLLESAAMTVNLTDKLDLRLSIEVEKDSRPPIGVKSTDTSYKTGLEYRF